jgi:hypothetical protein
VNVAFALASDLAVTSTATTTTATGAGTRRTLADQEITDHEQHHDAGYAGGRQVSAEYLDCQDGVHAVTLASMNVHQ